MISDVIKSLLKQGLSLIPANDGKMPLVKWKDKPKLTELEIFDLMSRIPNFQFAVKLGTPSDRLLCIDVDSKYKTGFDATIQTDIKELYPSIWERLLIERSPSGGIHLFYFVAGSEPLPHCPKIASRELYDEEVDDCVRRGVKPEKSKCFLEVKCEGGLTQVYPSDGYSRVKESVGGGIGILEWDEHCSLIALCSSYNEYFTKKGDAPIKIIKEEQDRYEVNPFEDFNAKDKGLLLEEAGWKFEYSRGVYNYYSKPDKKEKGVSASYSTETGRYKIFTASTSLEPIAYSPANLYCALECGGNKKEMFHLLVAKGFGKIKPNVEKFIIKRAAKSGDPLPPNISFEASLEYEVEKNRLENDYPYGTFWKEYGEGYRISREELYSVARELGYRKFSEKPVKLVGHLVKKVRDEEFYDELKDYIREEEDIEVFNAFEAFVQNSGKFTISRLDNLDKDLMLRSSKLLSYKFYRNGYLRIGVGGESEIELISYDGLDRLIWEEDIKDRDFVRHPRLGGDLGKVLGYADPYEKGGSLVYDFLQKAIGVDDYLYKCMGYYAHEYRDQEGYLCIATEQCENPQDGGGSGKNVFWSLFELITTFKSIPASMIQKSNNLLQSWDGQKVFCMSDMPKDFDLIFFKDIVTGNATVNKKYINEYTIEIEDMCKLGGSSNYSFDNSDPGINRRVRAIEFTNFFTLAGGVKAHYGKMFPNDFTEKEFQYFDNIMIDAIQTYLNADCLIDKKNMSSGGWSKQFSQKYTHLYEFFNANFSFWVESGRVTNDKFKMDYRLYCEENNIKKTYTGQNINLALMMYCLEKGIKFEHDMTWKDQITGSEKGRIFSQLGVEVMESVEDEELPF